MAKKNRRDRERRDAAKERIKSQWDQWTFAYSRPSGLALEELTILLKDLLRKSTLVTRGDLIDEHRRVHGVAFLVARAEVDEFRPRFAEALRRDGMPLVHPVTETGIANAATVDWNDARMIARCVPGVGGDGPTAAWRIADRSDDPVFAAYVNQRNLSGVRAVERAHRLATEAVTAGVASSVTPLPKNFGRPLLGPGKP